MALSIELGGLTLDVVKKDIKNVHLSVYPPTGRLRIAAPVRMSMESIRLFAISKLGWIKQQQRKLREQDREQPREYLDRESHYVWGRRYLLKVAAHDGAPSVEIKHRQLVLRVREPRSEESKQAALDEWYRSLVKQAAPDLIAKWEPVIGVNVRGVLVRKMKTLWGSCSPERGTIRLNVELAKKPPDCLEYILVHELVHLLEPTHNARFVKLLGQFMPKWQFYRDELNRLPVRHETWRY